MKPNHPSQRMNIPKVASGRLEPGIGITDPSSLYLPCLAPITNAPANAAAAPVACTTVDPAKSEKPASDSQPPPHCQEALIG